MDVLLPDSVLFHALLLETRKFVHQLETEVVPVSQDVDFLFGNRRVVFVLQNQFFDLIEPILDDDVVIEDLVVVQQLILHKMPTDGPQVSEGSYHILRYVVAGEGWVLLLHNSASVGL